MAPSSWRREPRGGKSPVATRSRREVGLSENVDRSLSGGEVYQPRPGGWHAEASSKASVRVPNRRALLRLAGALLAEQNDEWAISRRYMSLEVIAQALDRPEPQIETPDQEALAIPA